MRKIWNSWLKESVFLFSIIYTVTTIVNSAVYLIQGMRDDPSGNWHELTRAMIVLVGVLAYELARHLPIKNAFFKTAVVYAVTLPCVIFVVWSTHFIEPLAESAYRDILINYTGLFATVSIVAVIVQRIRRRQ